MADEDPVLEEAMDNLKEAGQRIRATQSLVRSQGMTDGEEPPRPPHAPFYGARHDRSCIPRGQASEESLTCRWGDCQRLWVLGDGSAISVACEVDRPVLVDLQVDSLVALAPVEEQVDDQSDAEEEEPHERPEKAELLGLDKLYRGLRARADLVAYASILHDYRVEYGTSLFQGYGLGHLIAPFQQGRGHPSA